MSCVQSCVKCSCCTTKTVRHSAGSSLFTRSYTRVFIHQTGKGFIPVDAFKGILRELDGAVPETELDDIVDEIDADGSGTVDFEGKYLNEPNCGNLHHALMPRLVLFRQQSLWRL